MKRRMIQLLSAVAGVLAFSAMSVATPILSQGFEDFTSGTTLAAGSFSSIGDLNSSGGGWWTNVSPNGDYAMPTVVSSADSHPVHSGSQSLQITNDGSSNTIQVRGLHSNVDNPANGTIETTFYVYWTRGTSSFQMRLGDVNVAASSTKSPGFAMGADGRLWAWKDSSNTAINIATMDSTDLTGWYGVKIDTHFTTDNNTTTATYDVFFDKGSGFNQIGSTMTAPGLPTHAASGLTFWPNNKTAGTAIYIDDVSITQVPEPASAALLILGGAGILLKRRRR